MVKSGAASSAASNCATAVQAKWMYSFDAGSGDTCSSGSFLDVCSSTSTMTFNYTSCSTQIAYSAGGSLYCIYSSTSGSNTYLTLYNDDTTTDESTTYRFTCMVLTTSGAEVYMTQYPQKCLANQNSTVISSPGASIILRNSTSCNPTTPAATTVTTYVTTTPAGTEDVSSALAVGLGVTFALICVLVIAAVLFWYFWNQHKNEKTRGDKDLEGGNTTDAEMQKDVEKENEVEETPVDRFDGAPPDVLPRDTPVSPTGENGRPTTSGSIHVCLPSGDESERDDKSIDKSVDLVEELPHNTTSYHVVGVHPGLEESDSGSEGLPIKAFAPQKAIVPKGAVALGNGLKARPKVGKRNKLPPMEGKHLPPIVEDTTPRSLSTPRKGSIQSIKRKFGPKGTVGIQETTTESGSEDLPGQPTRRGHVKLRQIRMQRGGKKPVPDKPERRVRTRSYRDHKDASMDDDESATPSTPVRVTRVDISSLAKPAPKKSPKNKRSDLKVVDMDGDGEKHVPPGATLEENPDFPFTAPSKRSWLQEEIPTETAEVWGKVSNMWKLGQVWMDKANL